MPQDPKILRAAVARASRAHQAEPTESTAAALEAARRDYAAARVEFVVERALRNAPPLTDAQRRRIGALLGGVA